MKKILPGISSFFSIRRNLRCKRNELAAYRNRRLRRLIRHAYRSVPYYRGLFDRHGIKPEDIQSAADLPKLPLTEKTRLQVLPLWEILSANTKAERLLAFSTSGSSGEPFTTMRAPLEQLILRGYYMRAMASMGLRLHDSLALIAAGDWSARKPPHMWRVLQSLDPRRRTHIDALLPVEEIRTRLRKFRPDVIVGYASVLARVAEGLTDRDRRLIAPRFVKTDSEVLTPLMRQQIRGGFDAPVYEMYDTQEFFMLAWECADTGGMHVCDDAVILEVLKDGRPCSQGESGEVVVTCLHSYAMPLIRYRLGDVVTKGADTCGCGLNFSTIDSIQGRMIDYFMLPDGRSIHPWAVADIALEEGRGWLRQYQLTQEAVDSVILRMVTAHPPPETLARIDDLARSVLGPEVHFQLRLVEAIDPEINGKFRVSRSFVHSEYDHMTWNSPGCRPGGTV